MPIISRIKNKDQDFRPNAYDLDSDGDGIDDVIEAGFTDANFNGIVDGTFGNQWLGNGCVFPACIEHPFY